METTEHSGPLAPVQPNIPLDPIEGDWSIDLMLGNGQGGPEHRNWRQANLHLRAVHKREIYEGYLKLFKAEMRIEGSVGEFNSPHGNKLLRLTECAGDDAPKGLGVIFHLPSCWPECVDKIASLAGAMWIGSKSVAKPVNMRNVILPMAAMRTQAKVASETFVQTERPPLTPEEQLYYENRKKSSLLKKKIVDVKKRHSQSSP